MAKHETNPDETIIRLLALNDRKSISLVYKHYAPLLVKSVTNLLGSTEDAEDIVQELMIAVWEKRKEMALTAPIQNYLLVAAYHRAINQLKLNKRLGERVLDISETDLAQVPDALPFYDRKQLNKNIHDAVMSIPGKPRAVLLLSLFFKMTNQEIANHFGVTVKAVEKNITKAYRLLKLMLQADK